MPFELAMEVWQFGKQPHGKGDRESNFRNEERESPEASASVRKKEDTKKSNTCSEKLGRIGRLDQGAQLWLCE